jgi:hypothetical protein
MRATRVVTRLAFLTNVFFCPCCGLAWYGARATRARAAGGGMPPALLRYALRPRGRARGRTAIAQPPRRHPRARARIGRAARRRRCAAAAVRGHTCGGCAFAFAFSAASFVTHICVISYTAPLFSSAAVLIWACIFIRLAAQVSRCSCSTRAARYRSRRRGMRYSTCSRGAAATSSPPPRVRPGVNSICVCLYLCVCLFWFGTLLWRCGHELSRRRDQPTS